MFGPLPEQIRSVSPHLNPTLQHCNHCENTAQGNRFAMLKAIFELNDDESLPEQEKSSSVMIF